MQNVKFKEILTDLRCEILKPFYKKSGSITLTSHEIIFFEDIYHSAHHDQSDYSNIFFFNHTLTD